MRWLFILVCFLSFYSFVDSKADDKDNASSTVNTGSGVIKVFSNDVFDLSPKTPAPTTRKGLSGKERYLGPSTNTNWLQDQRNRESCTPEMDNGMASFRNCVKDLRQRDAEMLQQSYDAVERRQGTPLRNRPARSGQRGPNSPLLEIEKEYVY